MKTYQKLEEHFRQYAALEAIASLLNWDKSVMMPAEGIHQRARQAAVLNVKMHEMLTAPQVGEWLAGADRKQLNPWQQANLDMMARMHVQATAVSADLVSRKMLQEAKTEMVWRQARQDSDFKKVAPALEALVELTRETATAKSQKMQVPPYEALMDHYAPHMRIADVDVIFDDLAGFLPNFLNEVLDQQPPPLPLAGPFPVAAQEKLGRKLAELLGFDFKWGRLDISAHPFSMGIGGDVRITTRYDEDDFLSAIQGVTHEVGHGFYDRHTPQEWQDQPVGISGNMGMAIHESQSLSLDMQLGRSREFFRMLAPHAREAFGRSGPEWEPENLYRTATQVTRGFIRVDADEVTYPLHIILRYRLERAMIDGTLQVRDLPEAWNSGMQDLIGATPPNDRLGCLQDIHWYSGSFGYFPAYALGAIIAAQFVHTMKQGMPDVFQHVGAFTGWLRDNVQSQGGLYKPQDLIEKATGQRMTASFFKQHLKERYQECSVTSAHGARRRA